MKNNKGKNKYPIWHTLVAIGYLIVGIFLVIYTFTVIYNPFKSYDPEVKVSELNKYISNKRVIK